MPNFYIRPFPRGTVSEIEAIEAKLPRITEELNGVARSLKLIQRLKEIAIREQNDSIANAILDVEKQGSFNQFLTICLLDVLSIYKNSISAIHLWDELFSLRQGYLLIYEALKTYSLHSKSLKELTLNTTPEVIATFTDLSVEIREFKRKFDYEGEISDFRNNIIGHIEIDPISFFNKLSKFDTDKAFAALKSFPLLLASMLNFSTIIFKTYTSDIIKRVSFDISFIGKFSNEIKSLLDELEHSEG